jgi:hypothetical protein
MTRHGDSLGQMILIHSGCMSHFRFPPLQGGGGLGRGQTAIASRLEMRAIGKPEPRHSKKRIAADAVCPYLTFHRKTGEGIKLLLSYR